MSMDCARDDRGIDTMAQIKIVTTVLAIINIGLWAFYAYYIWG